MEINLAVTIVIISLGALMVYSWIKGNESYRAIGAVCDAAEAFYEWRFRNPGVYIGLSDEGKSLLRQRVDAYRWYARVHPYCDCTDHMTWLLSLFDDLPPKSPKSFPNKGASRSTLFLF